MRKGIKDWSILIYANGNNELEPEMLKSKIDTEKIGSSNNINVVMEIGRESRELVNILRINEFISILDEQWTGVRRYYILQSQSEFVEDLGKVNMADPHTLFKFVTWGIKNYPAKRYMLILSGHGGSFIAALPDLSQDMPYAMGITEMCKVINMIKEATGANIDVLVLDICHMNAVEILYELGKSKDSTVKNVLTYVNNGPLGGMPYDKLIGNIEKNRSANIDDILKDIIETVQLDLIAIRLDPGKLKVVKKTVNDLAYIYLTDEQCKQMRTYNLANSKDLNSILYKHFLKLNKQLFSMIIHHKTSSHIPSSLINLTNLTSYKNFDDKHLSIYYKLSFAKNNYWTYVLANKKINDSFGVRVDTDLVPSKLEIRGLRNLIQVLNQNSNEEEIESVLRRLYEYKNWSYNIEH